MDAETDRDPPPRARDLLDPRGWLAATVVLLVLLGGTGLWQAWHYRPTATQAWEDIYTLHSGPHVEPPRDGQGWVSDAHRVLAVAFLAVGTAFVVALFRWAWRRRGGDAIAVAVAILAVGVTTLAPASGEDLLFDQLALWAVTVDAHYAGVWPAAFDETVRFVLRDGSEISPGTYRADVVAHLIVIPAVLVASAVVLAVRLRRR